MSSPSLSTPNSQEDRPTATSPSQQQPRRFRGGRVERQRRQRRGFRDRFHESDSSIPNLSLIVEENDGAGREEPSHLDLDARRSSLTQSVPASNLEIADTSKRKPADPFLSTKSGEPQSLIVGLEAPTRRRRRRRSAATGNSSSYHRPHTCTDIEDAALLGRVELVEKDRARVQLALCNCSLKDSNPLCDGAHTHSDPRTSPSSPTRNDSAAPTAPGSDPLANLVAASVDDDRGATLSPTCKPTVVEVDIERTITSTVVTSDATARRRLDGEPSPPRTAPPAIVSSVERGRTTRTTTTTTITARPSLASLSRTQSADAARQSPTAARQIEQNLRKSDVVRVRAPGRGEEVYFTREEVARHNQPDDLWIVFNNKVYDLTDFFRMNVHPGGPRSLLRYAGRDGTVNVQFHSEKFHRIVKRYYIGRLKDDRGRSCAVQ